MGQALLKREGFINVQMSIAQVKAMNRCIKRFQFPASHMSNRFRWEAGARHGPLKSED